jgi:hypothetical protein
MKGFLYIDNDKIGEADFKVIDESMGGIDGYLIAYDSYKKYKAMIQQHCDKKGISNIIDFNYRIFLEDNTELTPAGGIGVTDIESLDEIYVESAGIDCLTIEKIQSYK